MATFVGSISGEFGLLLLCLALQTWTFWQWLKVLSASLTLLALGFAGFFTVFFIRAVFKPRSVTRLWDSKDGSYVGTPMFLPTGVSHTRLIPAKVQFKDCVLYLGTPVGFRGRIGGILSVDEPITSYDPTSLSAWPTWGRLASFFRTWFSVDSAQLLYRGDNHLSLRQKLEVYLRKENKDPAAWPYAYLISVPRFLGYYRNVVSLWYLYTPAKELDAVVYEIQNSYGEIRPIFVPLQPIGENDNSTSQTAEKESKGPTMYRGEFRKTIFASPFEKVGTLIRLRFMDPLQPTTLQKGGFLSSTTSTAADEKTPRMIGRIYNLETAIDPATASWTALARLVFQWTAAGLIISYKVISTAVLLNMRGVMRMMSKPVIRQGTIARVPSGEEIELEKRFRHYLAACVHEYPQPLQVTYKPVTSISNESVCMQSPSYKTGGDCAAEKDGQNYLTVHPIDPAFYSRVANSRDIWEAMCQELEPGSGEADQTACCLSTSDTSLLQDLALSGRRGLDQKQAATHMSRRCIPVQSLPQWIERRRRGPRCFMDTFVLATEAPEQVAVYSASVLRTWAIREYCSGWYIFMDLYEMLVIFVSHMISVAVMMRVTPVAMARDSVIGTAVGGLVYLLVASGLTRLVCI